jgi:hypothetical protein
VALQILLSTFQNTSRHDQNAKEERRKNEEYGVVGEAGGAE